MDRGAHFHRCDLQVHSPRDLHWTGKDAVSAKEREAYAASLVAACRDKNLDAIAITDHHDLAFVNYIRKAAEEETDDIGRPLPAEQRLVVFPGIELTLGIPCQALLILDADFPDNLFAALLTALHLEAAPEENAKTAPVARLENVHSLRALKEELDKHNWLRDRYIIFPNVTNDGASSLLRKGMAGKYSEMPCVGGYVDGTVANLKAGFQSILAGKEKEWGNKRLACFQTADSRREDHNELGVHSTWIKWATPTAEALRQACLAQESRVSQEEPKLPAVVITGITVSNSTFLGPIDLELNPQYGVLIGGRGTGKSTILEYLRWALCDQPPDITDEDAPNYQARRSRLIEKTLKAVNATVDVRFIVNDVLHVVRRNSTDGSTQIKVGSDEFRKCTEDEVRTLLPIQAYSQKQLSDVSVQTSELTRFITSPIRSQLRQIRSRIEDSASRVRQSYGTRLRRRMLLAEIESRELEEKSLREQADALRGALTDLSEEDRALLDKGKSYQAANAVVESWLGDLRSLNEAAAELLQTITTDLGAAPEPPNEPHDDTLKAASDEYQSLMKQAAELVGKIAAMTGDVVESSEDQTSKSTWATWKKQSASFQAAYDAAVQRSSAHQERIEQLREVESRFAIYSKETRKLQGELKDLKSAEGQYNQDRDALVRILREHDNALEAQCKMLTADAGGAIRASVKRFAETSEFVERLREALSGSNVRREKVEALGKMIEEADEPEARWTEILNDLEKLAEFDPERAGIDRRPETPALAAAGLTAGDLNRIAGRLSTDDWLSLSLTEIESAPMFEYRSREGDYIEFKNASAGQQATALMKSLLNQIGPPLIIDQPEEDLDNPVMFEIVEQIWTAKRNRQLIFASHNANLVVNGDAELVVWCDYRKAGDQSLGKIAGEGAIDVPSIRDAIKQVMEGGEAVFKLRKEKYGF